MKRLLLIVIVLGAFAAVPAAGQVNVTVGAGGIYPAGTTFSGVTINGLQSGYGIEISSSGSALGQFCTVLLGLNNLGLPQNIVIPMAVAETDGSSQFHLNSLEAASSLLTMDEDARRSWNGGEALREKSVVNVPTIRLDTFMSIAGIARVDFLKIDTQGNDLAVIRSAGQRIRDIGKITLEVDVTSKRLYQGSPSKQEVLSFLQAAGFRLVSKGQQSHGQEENLTFECTSSQ